MLRRLRLSKIESNNTYTDFELEAENSKAFGFPDNTEIQDPDSSILVDGNQVFDDVN